MVQCLLIDLHLPRPRRCLVLTEPGKRDARQAGRSEPGDLDVQLRLEQSLGHWVVGTLEWPGRLIIIIIIIIIIITNTAIYHHHRILLHILPAAQPLKPGGPEASSLSR